MQITSNDKQTQTGITQPQEHLVRPFQDSDTTLLEFSQLSAYQWLTVGVTA